MPQIKRNFLNAYFATVSLYGEILNITPRVNHVPIPALKFLSVIINPFHPGIGRIMKLSETVAK